MSTLPKTDVIILRELGRRIAEAAADPVNAQRREICRRIDNRQKGRPSIYIYQEPWSELNDTGELTLRCEDEFCREIELEMRQKLYKWRHYPGDMTIDAESVQPYCISDSGFGIKEDVDVVQTDPENAVVSRHFNIQIADEADAAKIKEPVVTHDAAKTEECFRKRNEIFADILKVEKRGCDTFWFAPWDDLVRWTGVQEVLTDLMMRPDYVHAIIGRLVDCWMKRLDQYEDLGLLTAPARQLTVSGAAQIFSEVSPAMHREFAFEHEAPFFRRFGKVYYGCCEPLHAKVDMVAECFPNLYKISMSPWINFPEAVKNVGGRFVFAWKPNPALLAYEKWDPELARAYIRKNLTMAAEGGCFVEIHLKDLSTVRNEPWRLTEWERIAKEEAQRIN
ncbi:MAG: hypothetical protein PHC61_16430 [Chitinivibrionales bacterium]|nr:hypothetical protein [Chitinivibrionales bacterium]